ncbi:phage tail fiber C-terminal domain-containing protein, partial [Escherichia coli]
GTCDFCLRPWAGAAEGCEGQCVVRPLQILRADGTWENIGGMK